MLEYIGRSRNIMESCYNVEHHGISYNIVEYHGISWNIKEYYRISQNFIDYSCIREYRGIS